MQSTAERRPKPVSKIRKSVFAGMLLTSTALYALPQGSAKMPDSQECREYVNAAVELAQPTNKKPRFELWYNEAIAARKLANKYGENAPKRCIQQHEGTVAVKREGAKKQVARIPVKRNTGNFWKDLGEFLWVVGVIAVLIALASKPYDP